MAKSDEILNAALDCFTVYGYDKTTMSDIGKRIGMNKASLYYHFKDKLSLYKAVVTRLRDEHNSKLNLALNKCKNIEDEIITSLNHELDFWSDMSMNDRFAPDCHSDDNFQIVSEILDNAINSIDNILKKGISSKIFNIKSTRDTAKAIIEISAGLLAFNCPLHLPRDERKEGYNIVKDKVDKTMRVFLNGLKVITLIIIIGGTLTNLF